MKTIFQRRFFWAVFAAGLVILAAGWTSPALAADAAPDPAPLAQLSPAVAALVTTLAGLFALLAFIPFFTTDEEMRIRLEREEQE